MDFLLRFWKFLIKFFKSMQGIKKKSTNIHQHELDKTSVTWKFYYLWCVRAINPWYACDAAPVVEALDGDWWKLLAVDARCAVAQQLLGEARASGRVCAHDLKYEESFRKGPIIWSRFVSLPSPLLNAQQCNLTHCMECFPPLCDLFHMSNGEREVLFSSVTFKMDHPYSVMTNGAGW